VTGVPGGCLLVGVGGAEEGGFVEWARDELQSDREGVVGETAGDGDRGEDYDCGGASEVCVCKISELRRNKLATLDR